MIYSVILAGGKGERFWPKSRGLLPKQLIAITSEKTMLEETIARIEPFTLREHVVIVSTQNLMPSILAAVPNFPINNILLEPCGRNTAPAIGLAAVFIEKEDPDATMVVLPADHYIPDRDSFADAIRFAAGIAGERKALVTFGIKPTRPETGYGYIEVDGISEKSASPALYEVSRFREKPDLETARTFLESGRHFWNSGIFVWTVPTILGAFREHMPEMYENLIKLGEHLGDEDERDAIGAFYSDARSVSIDYGVMEKADDVFMVSGDFFWDDIGSWSALERVYTPDGNGNILKGDCVVHDCHDSILFSEDGMIAGIGVKDIVVVRIGDVTLVCDKNRAQEVREIVKMLRERKREDFL